MNHEQLFKELSRDEGRKKLPYKDSMGIWTGAVGHNLEAHGLPVAMLVKIIKRAGGFTEQEIDHLLRLDVQEAKKTVDALYSKWEMLPEKRQRVLVNMAFNMGYTVFKTFKKFWKAVKRGKVLEVGRQMEDSQWWGQVGPRAPRLRKMYEEDE